MVKSRTTENVVRNVRRWIMSEMKVECVCGGCGEPVKLSFREVKDGRLIMTLDEDHVCRVIPCDDCDLFEVQ